MRRLLVRQARLTEEARENPACCAQDDGGMAGAAAPLSTPFATLGQPGVRCSEGAAGEETGAGVAGPGGRKRVGMSSRQLSSLVLDEAFDNRESLALGPKGDSRPLGAVVGGRAVICACWLYPVQAGSTHLTVFCTCPGCLMKTRKCQLTPHIVPECNGRTHCSPV